MTTAPRIDIDLPAFWSDPYPVLAELRRDAPIAFIPQLGSTIFCQRDDIFISEKQIDVFSSHQPQGLMNKLMGHNMMRKDGEARSLEPAPLLGQHSAEVLKDWLGMTDAQLEALRADKAI